MQDVISRVMQAEKEAQRILQQARAEAELLIGEARRQAKVNEEQTRVEVRQAADRLTEDTVKAAEDEKNAQLARAVGEVESSVQLDDAVRRCVVDAVVDCVTGNDSTG